jgi:hypothetical protein
MFLSYSHTDIGILFFLKGVPNIFPMITGKSLLVMDSVRQPTDGD